MNFKHINFAQRQRLNRWQWMFITLLFLGVFTASVFASNRLRTVLNLRAENSALILQQSAIAVPANSINNIASPPATQLLATNAAISALNTPWPKILLALNQSKSSTLAILELESHLLEHSVRIVVEAENTHEIYDFIDAIGHQTIFQRVIPISQDSLETSGADKPRVRMSFEVEWRR